jgi:hypothetical protein
VDGSSGAVYGTAVKHRMTEKVNMKKFFAIAISIRVTSWRKIDKPLSDQTTNTEAANCGGLTRPGLVRF